MTPNPPSPEQHICDFNRWMVTTRTWLCACGAEAGVDWGFEVKAVAKDSAGSLSDSRPVGGRVENINERYELPALTPSDPGTEAKP